MPKARRATNPNFKHMKSKELDQELADFRDKFHELKGEINKAIVGYDGMLTDALVAIFSQGHILLEGVPGLGKTYLVNTLSRAMGLKPGRVQCTPDLMPADILGTQIVTETDSGRREMVFEKGPVFANVILVDEINRATPKTQAALLEVMQERAVTTGGITHPLPSPFFVMATQNPMEMEGTYPLPEAQLDRFLFKLKVPFPDKASLIEISRRTTGFDPIEVESVMSGDDLIRFQQALAHVPVADHITEYAAHLILSTHPDGADATDEVKRYVSYGSSPRGMQSLIRAARVHAVLDNRAAVSIDDLRRVAMPSLRHRVIMNFEGEAEAIDIDRLVSDLIDQVPTPAQQAAA